MRVTANAAARMSLRMGNLLLGQREREGDLADDDEWRAAVSATLGATDETSQPQGHEDEQQAERDDQGVHDYFAGTDARMAGPAAFAAACRASFQPCRAAAVQSPVVELRRIAVGVTRTTRRTPPIVTKMARFGPTP